MKASYKILIGLAVALGLAFFFFKKTAAAEDAAPVSTGAGGGVLETIIGGAKKIFGIVKKLFVPAAAAASIVPLSAIEMAGVGGILPIAGAGAPAVATLGPSVAAAEVVPGSAVGGGVAGILGPAIMLSIPWILGPPLERLMTKSSAEWQAELDAKRAKAIAERAATIRGDLELLEAAATGIMTTGLDAQSEALGGEVGL